MGSFTLRYIKNEGATHVEISTDWDGDAYNISSSAIVTVCSDQEIIEKLKENAEREISFLKTDIKYKENSVKEKKKRIKELEKKIGL